jgi:heme/copper-type cytochrome/quinol oxidase subunit 2
MDRRLLLLFGMVALIIVGVSNISSSAPREIKISVGKKNVFVVAGSKTPEIHVKAGEVVILTFTISNQENDVSHTFTVNEFKDQGWDIQLEEGTRSYKLAIPDKPGTYEFICTIKCGPGHDDMKGKLVIE